jgi:hypothetical protein
MLFPDSWARARATQLAPDGWHRRLLHASSSLSVSTFVHILIVWKASSGAVILDWWCPWCNVGGCATSHEKFEWEETLCVRICVSDVWSNK